MKQSCGGGGTPRPVPYTYAVMAGTVCAGTRIGKAAEYIGVIGQMRRSETIVVEGTVTDMVLSVWLFRTGGMGDAWKYNAVSYGQWMKSL